MRLASTFSRRTRRLNNLSALIYDLFGSTQQWRQAQVLWPTSGSLPTLVNTGYILRAYATISAFADTKSGAGIPDLPHPRNVQQEEELERGVPELKGEDVDCTYDKRNQQTTLPPALKSSIGEFGKWQWLSLEPDLLAFESDVASKETGNPRLVDLPENENDIYLWSCILSFKYRRHGANGVAEVLAGLQKRRSLRDVQGESAVVFWQMILREALHSEDLLRTVWTYAEWLYENHHVRWPKLYYTTIAYFLSREQTEQAFRWHMLLNPHFRPDAEEFVALLKRFVTSPNGDLQRVLRSLYTTLRHRHLYDDLVPFIYTQSHYTIACRWRNHLLLHDDTPRSTAARPFLRFVAAYLPASNPLVPRELHVAGLKEKINPRSEKGSKAGVEYEQHDDDFWYGVNRVHGQTFGIKEKTYNDTVGARWFASSWVPLDLALDVVRMLGFNAVGPLSLQSIALREESAERVHHRIQNLKSIGISFGTSTYVRAIQHFAAVGDQSSLTDLLQTDIHPDVFDDLETQERILKAAVADKDWKKYHLIVAVKAVCLSSDSQDPEHTVALISNHLLSKSFVQGDRETVLKMLKDMSMRRIHVAPAISDAISTDILEAVSPHAEHDGVDIGFYSTICRYFINMRYPLASEAFNVVLLRLAREGALDELERLSLAIARAHQFPDHFEGPLSFSHERDVPDLLKSERSTHAHFQAVPRMLDSTHPLHRMRLIFTLKLQRNLVRASVRYTLLQPPSREKYVLDPSQPKDYGIARGVRHLALLKMSGVPVSQSLAAKAITLRLAELYGTTTEKTKKLRRVKDQNQLSLEEAKDLCDRAWGSELLPSLSVLTRSIQQKAADREQKWVQYMRSQDRADSRI